MYVDALKPAALLSLSLQEEKLDIVQGLQHILKSSKSLKSLAKQSPLDWPTVKLVCSRVTEESGDKVYQGAVLNGYSPATLQACADEALADIKRLEERMRARLEWSDVGMLRAIIVFLDTQSWLPLHSRSNDSNTEDDDLSEIKQAVEYLTSHFREPLEAKGGVLESIQDEVEEIVLYARKYLSIGTECYQKIWYKLYTSPDARKWPNLIRLCELLFSLPFSNGHVEKMFSALKIVKNNRRTKLKTGTLSDLLDIKEEGPPLTNFNAEKAVSMWWDACKTSRRVSQVPRKEYRPREKEQSETLTETSSDTQEEQAITLEDWDDWFQSYDDEETTETDTEESVMESD